jgi:hypothetical protein
MNELYSSADGKVQFLELTALSPGQQFLSGHTLVTTQGGVSRSFTFPSGLPSDTSGRRFLVGTESFQALAIPGGFRADYVVPDNFFFLGNGTINFGEFSDLWNYSGLPTDGNLSLGRDGTTATNSPRNFSGGTGRVVLGATSFNLQALWWRAPAASESGWGVNITHQGNILFVTWFTYDLDGSGMWLVMSEGAKTGDNTYSGTLFRTTGPAFNSVPFEPSRVHRDAGGNGDVYVHRRQLGDLHVHRERGHAVEVDHPPDLRGAGAGMHRGRNRGCHAELPGPVVALPGELRIRDGA